MDFYMMGKPMRLFNNIVVVCVCVCVNLNHKSEWIEYMQLQLVG